MRNSNWLEINLCLIFQILDILGFLKLIIIANDQPNLPENFELVYQIRQVIFVLGEQHLLIKISLMFTLTKNTCS